MSEVSTSVPTEQEKVKDNQQDRDWPESRDYVGMCHNCGLQFFGPKFRIMTKVCRRCSVAFAAVESAVLDRNVESVRDKLKARAEIGLRKYGVTTERTDLSRLAWLNHFQQEMMDGAVYAEVLIQIEERRIASQ